MLILDKLTAMGFSFWLEDKRLHYEFSGENAPPPEVTETLLSELAANKDEAIAYISEQSRIHQIISAIPDALEAGVIPHVCLERALYVISRLTDNSDYYVHPARSLVGYAAQEQYNNLMLVYNLMCKLCDKDNPAHVEAFGALVKVISPLYELLGCPAL